MPHTVTFKGEAKKGPREEILYFGMRGELDAVRWNDWKLSFAGVEGNIMTGVRTVTTVPVIVNLRADPYERMPHESQMYMRWFADNMWLFVPIEQKVRGFLTTIPQYPFQPGAVLQPSDINYTTLTVVGALKKMEDLQLQIANPHN